MAFRLHSLGIFARHLLLRLRGDLQGMQGHQVVEPRAQGLGKSSNKPWEMMQKSWESQQKKHHGRSMTHLRMDGDWENLENRHGKSDGWVSRMVWRTSRRLPNRLEKVIFPANRMSIFYQHWKTIPTYCTPVSKVWNPVHYFCHWGSWPEWIYQAWCQQVCDYLLWLSPVMRRAVVPHLLILEHGQVFYCLPGLFKTWTFRRVANVQILQ